MYAAEFASFGIAEFMFGFRAVHPCVTFVVPGRGPRTITFSGNSPDKRTLLNARADIRRFLGMYGVQRATS